MLFLLPLSFSHLKSESRFLLFDRKYTHLLLINRFVTLQSLRKRVEAILTPCPALTCTCWMRSGGWMRLGRMKITCQQSRPRVPFSDRSLGSFVNARMQIPCENKFWWNAQTAFFIDIAGNPECYTTRRFMIIRDHYIIFWKLFTFLGILYPYRFVLAFTVLC